MGSTNVQRCPHYRVLDSTNVQRCPHYRVLEYTNVERCPHFRVLEYTNVERCPHFRVLEWSAVIIIISANMFSFLVNNFGFTYEYPDDMGNVSFDVS